jgi:hypothetical protein
MHTLKNDKGMHKRKENVGDWNFLSDLHPPCRVTPCCLVRWGCFIDGIEATHSSQSGGSPSLLSQRVGWIDVANVCAWPPLTANGVLHGSDGEEVEAPSPLHAISNVGSKQPVWFSLCGKKERGVELLTLLLQSLTRLDGNCPSPLLILWPTLLYCL